MDITRDDDGNPVFPDVREDSELRMAAHSYILEKYSTPTIVAC
jgi:hypothetical protein